MKDMIGYLKETLIFFSLITFFFIFSYSPTLAADDFQVYSSFEHTISDDIVNTTVDVAMKSNTTSRVLSFYTITIPQEVDDVNISLLNSDKDSSFTLHKRDSITDIAITFTDLVVSNSKYTTLRLQYNAPLAREGNKVTLPSSLTDIDTKSIVVNYPKGMGSIVWSSNTLTKFLGQGDNYKAQMDNPSSENTILILGDFLVYDFSISRALNNSFDEAQVFDITLPQDNQSQTLIINSIQPTPSSSSRDEEGNITISYNIKAKEQIDVSIKGNLLLLDNTQEIEPPTNPFLTKVLTYWNISEEREITNIERYIDRNYLSIPNDFESIEDFTNEGDISTFYESLYRYIVNRLDVDKSSSTVLQGGSRNGAKAVLENVSEANADDYADLCVAMFRHYGIPSRMVLGYLTDVSGITKDGIFHSWCEYYDLNEKKWIAIDPFLEDYKDTNLYKNPLKDHIKILVRGKSPVSPKLAFYTTNDFTAQSGSSEIEPDLNFTTNISFKRNLATSKYLSGSIFLKNVGNVPITRYEVVKENIPISENIDVISNEKNFLLLPEESISISFNIPLEEIGEIDLAQISVKGSSESLFTKTTDTESKIEITVPVFINIVSYLISVLILAIFLFLVYFGYKRFIL